jgi:hypothetical protein
LLHASRYANSAFDAVARETLLGDRSLAASTDLLRSTRHRDGLVTTAELAEEYYRRTVYIPFLDITITQFSERSLAHRNTARRLNSPCITVLICQLN